MKQPTAYPGGGSGDVATSKFAVPRRRPDVLRRARLNAFLDAAIGGRGVLIAAPAGYGKTTLVVDWLQTTDFAAAWLSLDAWDAELPAFARAMSGSLERATGAQVELGDERFWQPRILGTVLVNAAAAFDDYIVLVLDDVHTVEGSSDVMELLSFALERAPENLHVVMTSRTRPPIPALARLIARREVAVLGAAELAFTPREIRELLGGLGRDVSGDEAEAIFERTEGWAAALLLESGADPDAPRTPGTPAGLSLTDYVHGEALTTLSDPLRGFLREICVLPIWTPALCNDITGRRDAEALLRDIAARVLFVSQHADQPPTYRCHPLLRSLLMKQYRAEAPDAFIAQGRSAAETLSRFGMLNEAVDLLFDLAAWEDAADLLEAVAVRLMQQGQARGLADWIDRLPREVRNRPGLLVWRARAALKLSEYDEALRLIDDAVPLLRTRDDVHGVVQALFVRGETQRMKGYDDEALAAFEEARAVLDAAGEDEPALVGDALRNIGVSHALGGRLDEAIEELEDARRLLEEAGNLQGVGHACATLAQCYSQRGSPQEALGALQRAQSAYERAGDAYDLGMTLNNTGMVHYEIGEYEQALQVYERALRVTRGTGNTLHEAFVLAGIAETYRSMQRYDESLATYQEVLPMAEGLETPYLVTEITEGMALTKLYMGQGEEAAQLARSVAPKRDDAPARLTQHALVEAQVALERGDPAAALKLIDQAWKHLEPAGNIHGMAIAGLLRARALFENHQPRRAMTELETVERLCAQLGHRRFLRPYAARAGEVLEYASVRRVAESLLSEIGAGPARRSTSQKRPAPRTDGGPDMLPPVRALAFGRGSVFVGERQVSDLEWRSEKSKEMFFLLLLRHDPVTKEEIFAALWPDLPESKCNSNFHSSLYRLRRALFREAVVRTDDGAYQLNPRGVFDSDFDAFNRAMLEADVARDEEQRDAALSAAVAAYKGPLLSATYSEWVEPLRREQEERYIEALNELAARRIRQGHLEEALVLFRALEAVDPYSEAAAVGIMRSHLALNDGPAAARHYRRFRQLLKDDLDEEPSERLQELYRQATSG